MFMWGKEGQEEAFVIFWMFVLRNGLSVGVQTI